MRLIFNDFDLYETLMILILEMVECLELCQNCDHYVQNPELLDNLS